MKKYLLSIICTLLPIFASAQNISFADAGVKAICVQNWDTNGDGELSEAEAAAVTDLGTAFSGNKDITSFDEFQYFTGVTALNGSEFSSCEKLTSIILPANLQSIKGGTFWRCNSISDITIPASTSSITEGGLYGEFQNIYVDPGNVNYTSIDGILFNKDLTVLVNYPAYREDASYTIPSSVTIIDRCAFYSSRLRSITIPNSVTRFESSAFRYCRNLESIDIPRSVEYIGYDNFEYADKLTTVTIPNNVTYLGSSCFTACKKLQEIIVEEGNQYCASVDGILYSKDLSQLLAYPAGRTEISFTIPNHVTTINQAACDYCDYLNSVVIPRSVTSIGWFAFMNCSNLTSVTMYKKEPISISQSFTSNTLQNGTLFVPYGSKEKYQAAEGWSAFQHIEEFDAGSDEAQYWIELHSMLEYADGLYGRARGNSNVEQWMLEELSMMINRGSDMYDEHTAEEEEVHHMIEELNWICSEIEEAMNREPEPSEGPVPYAIFIDNNTALEFRYDDQRSAYPEAMDIYPFSSTVDRGWNDMAESIHSVVFNESFANCTTITSTEYWFFGCSNLETFIGLENLNTSNVTNMASMFHGCSSLTSLDLSSFNTTSVTEMKMMFYECPNLTTIYVSSGWSTANVSSSDYMFGGSERIVGGRGTQWNPDYTDAAYAHIDGGIDNPGYLTDINGSGTSDLDQRRADLLDRINQLMQEADVCHMLLDQKDPQRTSDLWNQLANIEVYIMDVRDRTERAESDAELDECEDMIQRISEDLAWLRMKIDDYEIVEGEAYFDGLTAWVYGDATLDDAFAEVGRESAVQTIAAIVWEGTGALTAEQMQGITNPNLLVYVNDASKAPAGVRNVIVNGTAANITLSDASGNNNFFCPEPFTAQSISYTRNFSQTTEIGVSRGWETIALPFTVQSITHESHGVLEPFGINNGYPFWLRQLGSDGLARATVLEANVPFLICMPNNSVYPSVYNQVGNVTFSSSNVTVPETHPLEMFGANVILTPAFQNQAAGSDIFTLNVGEAQGSYPEGSVFISNYRSVRPFQCYARHSNQARGTDEIQYIPLTSIGGGDDTTAIMEIIQPAANGTGDWYSLDGRKLSSKPTQKGIYIQNGKKIVIK